MTTASPGRAPTRLATVSRIVAVRRPRISTLEVPCHTGGRRGAEDVLNGRARTRGCKPSELPAR